MSSPVVSALFSASHVLGLGLGLGGVWMRGRSLRALVAGGPREAVLAADNVWGVAALTWLGTGLMRAFGGLEKGTAYYLASPAFAIKMALFLGILVLEAWPMFTLIRWRMGRAVDPDGLRTLIRLNDAEVVLITIIPFVAAWMARGG